MKKLLQIILIMCCGLLWHTQVLAAQTLNLMPYPSEIKQQAGHFVLLTDLKVAVKHISPARQELITQQLELLVKGEVLWLNDSSGADMLIELDKASEDLVSGLQDNEQYHLRVSPTVIQLQAPNELGILHGIQTLLQLVDRTQHSIPAVEIHDQPRFAWRGLLIDSVRHFMPLDTIKRQLRGMASAKLNVLHWHLTDDQGWRFESLAYPKLHQLASDGLYYTRQQIREVVAYAALLGIRVVPEFDVPGHASAIAVAYPELISDSQQYSMQRHWGVFEPLLDPSNPQVYDFIETIVAELAELFPDPYVHIGGDEINPKQWQQSPAVHAFMQQHQLSDELALHRYFNQQVHQILAKHGKYLMGWDEIFDSSSAKHADLPTDIVVQSWRGLDSLHNIASSGYQALLSTGFYIDQPQQAAYHYRNDPLSSLQKPGFKAEQITQWQHWQFSMPRLKGSAVSGEFVILKTPAGTQVLQRFNQQQARLLEMLEARGNFQRFRVDSWMGPSQFEVDLTQQDIQQGRILIGNTPYTVNGTLLAQGQGSAALPEMVQDFISSSSLPVNTAQLEQNILGGEATIWSELVTADNLDLRIWPRLYVIAERLWSPATLNDESFMYQRLAAMEEYATEVAGLAFKQQQLAGFKQLTAADAEIEPLLILAEAIEQAQYYTRHHSKFQQDKYHQLAELNQFVDYLPAQSLALVELKQNIVLFKQGDKQALQTIKQQLDKWQQNIPALQQLIKQYPKLSPLSSVVMQLSQVIELGQQLITQCASGKSFNKQQQQTMQQQLWQAAQLKQEMVLSSALAIEALVFACHP